MKDGKYLKVSFSIPVEDGNIFKTEDRIYELLAGLGDIKIDFDTVEVKDGKQSEIWPEECR